MSAFDSLAGTAGNNFMRIGKSYWPNVRRQLPRTDFGQFDTLLGQMQQNTLSPQQITAPQIATINAGQQATNRNLARSQQLQGLGGYNAFARDSALENSMNSSALRGQAYGSGVVDSANYNLGVQRSGLDALLGRASIQSGERGQDLDQFYQIMNLISGYFPR